MVVGWARFVSPPVFGVALSLITQRIIPENRSKVKYQSEKLWCRVATGGYESGGDWMDDLLSIRLRSGQVFDPFDFAQDRFYIVEREVRFMRAFWRYGLFGFFLDRWRGGAG